MAVLLDADGPFKRCTKGHRELPTLPVTDPPAALFAPVEDAGR